jgi:hypothetical protein
VNRSLSLLMTLSALACSPYEDESEPGYLIEFGTEDITFLSWSLTATRLTDDGEENLSLSVEDASAAARADGGEYFSVVLIPPGTTGFIDEPAPGWVKISIPTPIEWMNIVTKYDETYPLDEAPVTYTDESGVHRELTGSLFIDDLWLQAEDDTAHPEGGWYDGGNFRLTANLVDATLVLDDGPPWDVEASLVVAGETPGTPVESTSGDGDGDGDGDTGGDCSAYAGPEADPQRDVQCQAAWSAQCNGDDKSAYCDLYNSSSWGSAGNCPYC